MPNLKLDQFDEAPSVGDKIKVEGKVISIDDNTGDVEVSYDNVSIVKGKSSSKNYGNNLPQENMPQSQTLDEALNQAFNKTQ